MQELKSLQQKIGRLIKGYEALKSANAKLAQAIAAREKTIRQQQQSIAALEAQCKKSVITEELSGQDPAKREALKQFLNELIDQVDYNIKLLNH